MVGEAASLRKLPPGESSCLLCRQQREEYGEEPNCDNCSQMKLHSTLAIAALDLVYSQISVHNDGLVPAPCGAQQSSHGIQSANEIPQPNSVVNTCLVADNIPTTASTVMISSGHGDPNFPAETLPIDQRLFRSYEALNTQKPPAQVPKFRAPVADMDSGSPVAWETTICVLDRLRCAASCGDFNNFIPQQINMHSYETHINLFRRIVLYPEPVYLGTQEAFSPTTVGQVGAGLVVGRPFNCTLGHNMFIGDNVNIGVNCTIDDVGPVRIGNHCFIGPNVTILTDQRDVRQKERREGSRLALPVVIERDCWIGGGATILPGCTIGQGSIVGAGSVVTEVCSTWL